MSSLFPVEGGIVYFCLFCGIVLFFACFERGFSDWQRIGYVIGNVILAGFVSTVVIIASLAGYKHESSLSFDNHTYYITSILDDSGGYYDFFICDSMGIICPEKISLGWEAIGIIHYGLRISEDKKSIEVITTNYYSEPAIIFTYTPETAETE